VRELLGSDEGEWPDPEEVMCCFVSMYLVVVTCQTGFLFFPSVRHFLFEHVVVRVLHSQLRVGLSCHLVRSLDVQTQRENICRILCQLLHLGKQGSKHLKIVGGERVNQSPAGSEKRGAATCPFASALWLDVHTLKPPVITGIPVRPLCRDCQTAHKGRSGCQFGHQVESLRETRSVSERREDLDRQ